MGTDETLGKPGSPERASLPWAAPTAFSTGPGSQVLAPTPNAWQSPGMNAKHKVPDTGVGRVGGRQATHKHKPSYTQEGKCTHTHITYFIPWGIMGTGQATPCPRGCPH